MSLKIFLISTLVLSNFAAAFADRDLVNWVVSKPNNVCCHHCRISQNRERVTVAKYADCLYCRNTFCENCLTDYLKISCEELEGGVACPVCIENCCCNFERCTKDHRHCYTYRRTKKRRDKNQLGVKSIVPERFRGADYKPKKKPRPINNFFINDIKYHVYIPEKSATGKGSASGDLNAFIQSDRVPHALKSAFNYCQELQDTQDDLKVVKPIPIRINNSKFSKAVAWDSETEDESDGEDSLL